MSERIEIRTLTDGGQQPRRDRAAVAAFLDGAERIARPRAVRLQPRPGERARSSATRSAARPTRGVRMRFAYNVDHANPIPVPPPPEPDALLIASLPVEAKAIAGIPDLMHHKYVIRDGAAVWTGSLNWTDDSWSRQENVVAVVESPAIAKAFTLDFDQLWTTGDVEQSGFVDPRWDDGVRAWFTPGHGEDLSARIAKLIRRAQRRVRICSPVITTGPGARHARAGDRRQVGRPRGLRRRHPGARRDPPVAGERQRLVEAAAAAAGAWPGRSPARSRRRTATARCTTSCTRRSPSATTRCSSARSTSRAAARRTPRTCSRSRTPAIADRLAAFVDEVRARYAPVELPPRSAESTSAPSGRARRAARRRSFIRESRARRGRRRLADQRRARSGRRPRAVRAARRRSASGRDGR